MAKKQKPTISELRLKAAEIYLKLYKVNENGVSLADSFETDEIDLMDDDSDDYMELIMDVELIEDQIKRARRTLMKSYGY